jgi:hypothetical protein
MIDEGMFAMREYISVSDIQLLGSRDVGVDR